MLENSDSLNILFDYGFVEGQTQNVVFSGDTLVNEIQYSKMYFNGYSTNFFNEIICSPEFIQSHNSECLYFDHDNLLIREDSSHAKLYLHSLESNRDYLIMDLDLVSNDVFTIARNKEDTLFFNVDSVYSTGGTKIIEFSNENQFENHGTIKLKFIEGVGPNWGLFYGFNDSKNLLLCSYNDDMQMFKITNDSECEYWWVGDEWPDIPISIEENHQNDFFKILKTESGILIQPESDYSYDFAIYDLQGRLQTIRHNVFNETFINLMKDQIYIIKLISDSNISIKKILIN